MKSTTNQQVVDDLQKKVNKEALNMTYVTKDGRSYNAIEFETWLNALKPPKISDKGLILALRQRWDALYQKCYNGEINSREYATRRRAYENMIWELGGVLDVFLEDYFKEREGVRRGRTKKKLMKFLFSQRFGRYYRGMKMVFMHDEKLILLPKKGRLHDNHWDSVRTLLEDNNWAGMLAEFDRLFGN